MPASSISNPWQGTHRVDIGASLGKALKARRNGGEAGTSSLAPGGGPGKGRRNLPDREFYSLRYQHKPASIDPRKPGMIQFNGKESSTTPSIVIEQASNQPNESIMFAGQEISLNKLDCVLIYDEDTGTFTLEKLDGGLKLSPDRSLQSIMPRDSSPSSSTPSPPAATGYAQPTTQVAGNRRKLPAERITPSEIDDEIAALVQDIKPTPRAAQPRPSRPQKEEEEEEEEEELPLIQQQQRIQQEQWRKQKEQQEQQEREASKREQERIREQQQQLLRVKQQREQEKKEQEEQERRRREKELQDQREREQLLREQEQRRIEQQQQEQQQRRYISTNKPKVKAPPKKKSAVPMPGTSKAAAPAPALVPPSSSSRSLPKRPAEDARDVEEFGAIVSTRPTKTAKTKPSQTAGSPPPSSSSGGLALPGSSSSLSALAPEPMLPSSNSIQRYGQKAKAAPPPPPPPQAPPPEIQELEDSDDEGDWDEVPVPTNAQGVSTPVAASTPQADMDNLEDEIFGDLFEEVNGNASSGPAAEADIELDLEHELAREFEEAGLGAEMSPEDSDEEMEPVTPGVLPIDQGGPIMSLNQMLGGSTLPEADSDFSSSSDDDSDY